MSIVYLTKDMKIAADGINVVEHKAGARLNVSVGLAQSLIASGSAMLTKPEEAKAKKVAVKKEKEVIKKETAIKSKTEKKVDKDVFKDEEDSK